MPFLQEFGPDDIFRNNLETSPRRKISAYSGSVYIEDSVYKGQNISTGSISLYEINVDRTDISGTNTARAATGSMEFSARTVGSPNRIMSGTILLEDQGGIRVLFQYDTNIAPTAPVLENHITSSQSDLLQGYNATALIKIGAQSGYGTGAAHATAFMNALNLANGTSPATVETPGLNAEGESLSILGINGERDGAVVTLTQDINKYSQIKGNAFSNPAPSLSGLRGNTNILVENSASALIEAAIAEVGFGGGAAEPSVYAYVIKDGTNMSFKSVTTGTYSREDYGSRITGTLPLTSSVDRLYIQGGRTWPFGHLFRPDGNSQLPEGTIDLYFSQSAPLFSLRNTIEKYKIYSPTFTFSSSKTNDQDVPPFLTGAINMISIPSIYYGSAIERGTVDLQFYYTGTLMDRCKDEKRNGELISTQPGSEVSGSTVGLVLYDEGFILLYNETPINGNAQTVDSYTATGSEGAGKPLRPNWTYFWSYNTGSSGSQGIDSTVGDGRDHAPGGATRTDANYGYFPSSSHFVMEFNGKNNIPTMTMFTHAPAGRFNNSQNPTWISSSYSSWKEQIHFDSSSYVEPKEIKITNTVQSDYCNYDDNFEKQVFISKVAVYDEDKNLLGIAKLANPVLKRETDSYTFKLKLDM